MQILNDFSNNVTNLSPLKNVNFKGHNLSASKKDGYDTYISANTDTKKVLTTAAFIFGGLSVLFSLGVAKLSPKLLKAKLPAWMSILEGTSMALMVSGIGVMVVAKKSQIKLKPISKEEQVKKEQKLRALVQDLAKQKDAEISGIHFQDFSKLKGHKNTLAAFDWQTGYLVLDERAKNTNLDINETASLIVHELTHAKQFANIARAKDGLYDYNKISVLGDVEKFSKEKKDKILSTSYENLPALAKADIDENPQNFTIVDRELDTKNNIKNFKAIKMYLENPNISKYDLPLIVDEEYYKKVSQGKEPLTLEETAKVKSYLDYMEKSITIQAKDGEVGNSVGKTYNYLNNPMEIDAFKAQQEYFKTGKVT